MAPFKMANNKDNLKDKPELQSKHKVVVLTVPSESDIIPPAPHNSSITSQDFSPPIMPLQVPTPHQSRTGVGEHLSRLELEAKIFGYSSDEEDEKDKLSKSNSQVTRFSETETTQFACSPVLILIIFVNLITATLIILTSIQLYKDEQWNSIIHGNKGFPQLSTGQVFFKDKALNLASALDEMVNHEKFDSFISRDAVVPFSYIATMANFLLISILHAIVIYTDILQNCTEGSKWTSFTYIFLGLLSIGTCVLMDHLTIKAYEDNTLKAAQYFLNGKSTVGLNHEKLLLQQNDEQILGNILTFCAYFSTNLHFGKQVSSIHTTGKKWEYPPVMDINSRSIRIYLLPPTNKTESYSVEDLSILGFCRDPKLASSIYILSIILPIICWAIPILNAIRGICCEYCLKKDQPRQEPHKTMTQTDKWTHAYQVRTHNHNSNASSRARIHPDEAYQ